LHGPPAYYTSDWEAAKLSVERLAALMPNVVACGHGRPMAGPEMMDALRFLADNFDRVARPAHGRYAGHPAVTGERGLVSVPPPGLVYIRNAALLIGAGLAAGAVLLARRRRAR
jgi:hypothetical protein